jgi:CelD/BcsL family acetyltransferase involved in cellulose biosynthesis
MEGLSQLEKAWTGLESSAWLPMQQFIWAEACAAVFARQGELRVLVVDDGGEIKSIAPLMRGDGASRFQLLGVEELQEPTDVLYASPDALTRLAKGMADLRFPLFLNRIPAGSSLPAALGKAFRHQGVMISGPDRPWPTLSLDQSWFDPESRLHSGHRSDLRHSQRIAAEFGEVSAQVLAPTPETLAPLLAEAFAVEAAGWKGKSGTALSLDRLRGEFFHRYAAAACRKGILRLGFLRIGGRAAAMQLAVETGGCFWLLKIGYDNQFAHSSPGNLLLLETLRYAARRGLKSLAFLGGVEPWTRHWTKEEEPCVVLRGYPWNPRGMSALARDAARSAWSKMSRVRGSR